MSPYLKILTISALLTASTALFSGVARAALIGEPLAIAKAIPAAVQPVYWRGHEALDGVLRWPADLSLAR